MATSWSRVLVFLLAVIIDSVVISRLTALQVTDVAREFDVSVRTIQRRMAKLGICANIFTNHIWYWGDQHHDLTVGPERARRMEACRTAEREGVSFSIHTDACGTGPFAGALGSMTYVCGLPVTSSVPSLSIPETRR